jgi:hypothetical protein
VKGIVTYSLRGRTRTEQSELVMGWNGMWHPSALPEGAVIKRVELIIASTSTNLTGKTKPWHEWLAQCADGIDGPEPLLMGDDQ